MSKTRPTLFKIVCLIAILVAIGIYVVSSGSLLKRDAAGPTDPNHAAGSTLDAATGGSGGTINSADELHRLFQELPIWTTSSQDDVVNTSKYACLAKQLQLVPNNILIAFFELVKIDVQARGDLAWMDDAIRGYLLLRFLFDVPETLLEPGVREFGLHWIRPSADERSRRSMAWPLAFHDQRVDFVGVLATSGGLPYAIDEEFAFLHSRYKFRVLSKMTYDSDHNSDKP